MTRMLGLRKQVVAQEKRNVEPTNSNTYLRKQVLEFGCAKAKQKEKITSLEKELATSLATQKAAEAELETTLKQMKFVAVDATIHVRAELIEEFKAGKHSEWDLDYEIGFWKERETKLAEGGKEGDAVGESSTPKVKSP